MTALYADNALSGVPNQGSAKTLLEQLRDVVAELLGGSPGSTLAIAGGGITPTRAQHSVDTEGAAGTDDLDNILQDNHGESRLLLLRAANAGHVVTVRHNIGAAGKILLSDGAPFVLNSTKKWLLLIRVGTTWEEVARFYGDKLEEMRAWLQLEPDTVSTAADRNITAADRGKVITLTGGTDRTFTFTATWAALGDGWACYFKNASTAFLTIVPAAGTIDGKASLVLKPGEIVELRSDGANGDLIGGRLTWRERLTAPRTFYVRPDGSDANTGLVNSAGGAFLTPQKAWTTVQQSLDLAGFTVTIQLADGTYTAGMNAVGVVTGQSITGGVVLQGNNAAPANVVISTTGGDAINVASGARLTVKDLELRTTTSGSGINIQSHGFCAWSNVRFGACANFHIDAFGQGRGQAIGNYAIVGGAQRHFNASTLGFIQVQGYTITLTGAPAFSSQFARASNAGVLYVPSNVWSGAATGQRYAALQGGVIDTEGAGANYLPGSVAGSVTAPGCYA